VLEGTFPLKFLIVLPDKNNLLAGFTTPLSPPSQGGDKGMLNLVATLLNYGIPW
jgi:hypothetical protein